jgi:hypothetical protein
VTQGRVHDLTERLTSFEAKRAVIEEEHATAAEKMVRVEAQVKKIEHQLQKMGQGASAIGPGGGVNQELVDERKALNARFQSALRKASTYRGALETHVKELADLEDGRFDVEDELARTRAQQVDVLLRRQARVEQELAQGE